MKKIYLSILTAVFAILISNSAFAQGLTCDTWTKAAWPWDDWGENKHGDTIHVDGSYTLTYDKDGVTYQAMEVVVSLMRLDQTTWAAVYSHNNIVANDTIGNLSSGKVSHDFVIPCTFPLTEIAPDDHWLIQLRARYGKDGVVNTAIDEWANAWVTVVPGGLVPAENPPAGIWINTWDNSHGQYGTYGEVVHGEKIPINGTFSQKFESGGTMLDIKDVKLSILGFTSAWANNMHNQVFSIHNANQGDLSCSIINSSIVVSDSLPINTTLPAGDFYIIQVRADYANDDATKTKWLWANAWMSIVGGATSVSDKFVNDAINVFPNPVVKGQPVMIKSNQFTGDVHVKVFNIAGAQVYSQVHSVDNLRISTGDFSPGMYTVAVKSGAKIALQKLIVSEY